MNKLQAPACPAFIGNQPVALSASTAGVSHPQRQPLPRESGIQPHVAKQQKHSISFQMLCNERTVTQHPDGAPLPPETERGRPHRQGCTRGMRPRPAGSRADPIRAKEASEPWLPRGQSGVTEKGVKVTQDAQFINTL